MGKVKDLTGQKFNMLTVIEKDCNNRTDNKAHWICKCDCGNYTVVRGTYLVNSRTKSCGCLRGEAQYEYKHGLSNTRLYRIWCAMKQRCYSESFDGYKNYGGRGITICDEWLNDFQVFYDWSMANGYAENLTIDRIDVNGNYEPSNCRWATMKEQLNNRRNTVLRGEKEAHVEWGLHVQRLKERNKKEKAMLADYLCANHGAINGEIAEYMGCSVRKVQRLKAELRADGLLL